MCLSPSTIRIATISDTVETILNSKFRKDVMENGCPNGKMLFVAIAALIISKKMPRILGVEPMETSGGPTMATASQNTEFLDSLEIQKVFSDYRDPECKHEEIYNKFYLELKNLLPKLPDEVWEGVDSAMNSEIR